MPHTPITYLSRLAMLIVLASPTPTLAENDVTAQLVQALDRATKPHPRLFLSGDRTQQIKANIEADPLLEQTWQLIRQQADGMLDLEPMRRDQQEGRRLLGVSRTVLRRVSTLSLAYRLTDEPAYLERAKVEMLAAAGFEDWNPDHFLDVAEMTAAMAIGYDWLYHDLSDEERATIRQAIIDLGLKTAIDRNVWWTTSTNNWAQVCHGGMVLGSLAVMEHEPELAKRLLTHAVETIHLPMDDYGPHGGYPEGPGYWDYGTSYNVLLIDALATALGTDFGLSEHPRFMASATYHLHVHGPTNRYFNYSDNSERASVAPAMYWFARQLDQPGLLAFERRKLEHLIQQSPGPDGQSQRFLPFLLIWAKPGQSSDAAPSVDLHYVDEGHTPIGTHRSGWDRQATYVGLKAGTPSANHGQMDIGTFVMDARGVRWAIDLGLQSYHSLESAGVNLWNRSEGSERWTIFRLNNHSKNTLVVNDEVQRADGFAPVIQHAGEGAMPHTIIDMTEVYAGQLAAAKRGVGLRKDGSVVVQDELQGTDDPAEVRWAMMTRAEVEIVSSDLAILRQDGQELAMQVHHPANVELEIYDSATPRRDYDAANPGTRMVGFKITLPPGETQRLTVQLSPGGTKQAVDVEPFSAW